MDDPSGLPFRTRYRGTLTGDGSPGPIEERLGRRLLRLVDPFSAEGACLLESGRVDLTGPDGERLGCVAPDSAHRLLLERLEQRLARDHASPERPELVDGIGRLKARR